MAGDDPSRDTLRKLVAKNLAKYKQWTAERNERKRLRQREESKDETSPAPTTKKPKTQPTQIDPPTRRTRSQTKNAPEEEPPEEQADDSLDEDEEQVVALEAPGYTIPHPSGPKILELEKYFQRNMAKGALPTLAELRRKAEALGLKMNTKSLAAWKTRWKGLAAHKEMRRPKSHRYMSYGAFKFGSFQTDAAFLPDSWGRGAEGYDGFIVFVEYSTGYLFTYPIKNKNTATYRAATNALVESGAVNTIRTIYSDREGALWSKNFRAELYARHKIKLAFLKTRSKAYLAERSIRFLKSRVASLRRTTGERNWPMLMQGVVDQYNNKKVPGTDFRRRTIDESNFAAFMRQKLNLENFNQITNYSSISCTSLPEAWNKSIFRYPLRARVLIEAQLDKDETKTIFGKKTIKGWTSKTAFFISGRFLRTTKDQSLTPGTLLTNL